MKSRTCTKCGVSKLSSEFNKQADKSHGIASICKACKRISSKQWREENKERHAAMKKTWNDANKARNAIAGKAWREANQEHVYAKVMAWRNANPERNEANRKAWHAENSERHSSTIKAWQTANLERHRSNCRNWRESHPEKISAFAANRRASKLMATPRWADIDAIECFYAEANRLTRETGVEHHVDHAVPLQSKTVCGLHCEANLQILEASKNTSKGNRHWPDMP